MLAFDQDTWATEQDTQTRLRRSSDDELDRERLLRAESPDPEDEDYDDEDLDLDEDDDLDLDEEDDLDDDVVPGYDTDLDDEDEDLDDPLRAQLDGDDDLNSDDNEIPEHEETNDQDFGYPNEQEVRQPQEGSDGSYSEQTDVTPPRPHEFPSEGSPKTDFSSRPQGRTTGRMVGHEPGTEGI
ncbi:hypothetical protein [uncultured Mucilaginibacter sp.]|uniref:hypothetical protein n=1 Tax=uncultured Mucilaginibacter sp. TaxID=797541 RepID=UPI0025F36390|nr:hypothetical protein [uncultured Mucilaginibacter sp.]